MRRRILERILEDRDSAGPAVGGDPESVARSILESLRRIFNSGQDDAPIDGRYGLPDVRGLARHMPQSIGVMEEAIRVAIRDYEPRLARVWVEYRPKPESNLLCFEITAELKRERSDDEARTLQFLTRVDNSGAFRVSR